MTVMTDVLIMYQSTRLYITTNFSVLHCTSDHKSHTIIFHFGIRENNFGTNMPDKCTMLVDTIPGKMIVCNDGYMIGTSTS